jgi:hypothetical protein
MFIPGLNLQLQVERVHVLEITTIISLDYLFNRENTKNTAVKGQLPQNENLSNIER